MVAISAFRTLFEQVVINLAGVLKATSLPQLSLIIGGVVSLRNAIVGVGIITVTLLIALAARWMPYLPM